MRQLNRDYRGLNKPTDVLSFSLQESVQFATKEEGGDLFLCPSYIKKQARRFGVSCHEEFDRVLIHGILHLGGYNHDTKSAAKKMFGVQEELLKVTWRRGTQ